MELVSYIIFFVGNRKVIFRWKCIGLKLGSDFYYCLYEWIYCMNECRVELLLVELVVGFFILKFYLDLFCCCNIVFIKNVGIRNCKGNFVF